MTKQEALKFWEWRYENAKDYYDDHWEADERRSHREYVQALEWAVKALADRKTEPQWWLTESNLDDYKSGFMHGYAQAKHEYESKTEPQHDYESAEPFEWKSIWTILRLTRRWKRSE